MLIIALAMLVLIGLVGLAIDGGNTYQQRRKAQNGTDGAALSSTRLMLTQYMAMVLANPDGNVDGSSDQETTLSNAIRNYASENGVVTSTLTAYFVDINRQIVTVQNHIGPGVNCGWTPGKPPCQVGQNGLVPWAEGALGITVSGQSRTGSFFMGVLGFTTDSAVAHATAMMGAGVSASNIKLLPVGFFTTTTWWNQLEVGQTYTLIAADSNYGSGNTGWANFTPNGGSAQVAKAWSVCGYNPSIDQAHWPAYCPSYASQQGWGPTQYWTGGNSAPPGGPMLQPTCSGSPCGTGYFAPAIQYGPGVDGWWLQASTGDTVSVCHTLQSEVQVGKIYALPVYDWFYGGGANTYYHLLAIGIFQITGAAVDCNVPNPGGGSHQQWNISGTFMSMYSNDGSGRVGDPRHTSSPKVFLVP